MANYRGVKLNKATCQQITAEVMQIYDLYKFAIERNNARGLTEFGTLVIWQGNVWYFVKLVAEERWSLKIGDRNRRFNCILFLRSTKNAFLTQSKSRILYYDPWTPIWPPEKLSRGEWHHLYRPYAGVWVEFHALCSLRIWCARLSNFGLCFIVYFICSRTRSPKLWDFNRGNSCIWLYLLI